MSRVLYFKMHKCKSCSEGDAIIYPYFPKSTFSPHTHKRNLTLNYLLNLQENTKRHFVQKSQEVYEQLRNSLNSITLSVLFAIPLALKINF